MVMRFLNCKICLQTRREKEIMSQNRILREKQYQKRREQDFQEALAREAVSLFYVWNNGVVW